MTTDTRHPRVCMRIKKVAHLSPFDAFLFKVEFFRLKELVQMKNGLTTSLPFYLFFLTMLNIWVGQTTPKGEK